MPNAAATRTTRAAIVPIATPNLCLFAASKAELLPARAGGVALDEATAADTFADDDAAPTGGGVTISERWEVGGWSYAEGAQHELIRLGIPAERILVATARESERQRTFESAVAVRRALQTKGIHPKALNVFTWGPHARRSRLVFAKVETPEINVGAVSWTPAAYDTGPWWRSSDRAKELLAETAGYIYEAAFNSGRSSNFPEKDERIAARDESTK